MMPLAILVWLIGLLRALEFYDKNPTKSRAWYAASLLAVLAFWECIILLSE